MHNVLHDNFYKDLDVLHICLFYGARSAIQKVIDNIIYNGESGIRQAVLPIDVGADKRPENLNLIFYIINTYKPRILHLHFNSFIDISFFEKINYKPYIIQTIHADVASRYTDFVDLLICIHEECFLKNDAKKRILIENTPDVSLFDKYEKNDNGVCCTFRFVTEKINEEVIDLFSNIKDYVHLYGYLNGAEYGSTMRSYIKKYENIVPHRWSKCVEEKIITHKIFGFYLSMPNPQFCYGLSTMEAAALGVPTVSIKRRQPFQIYLKHGINGFMVENKHDFIKYCNLILGDEKLYDEICCGAKEHSLTLTNVMPKEYCIVYNDVLQNYF